MPESSDNFAYTLARIRWDLFGTLTFRGRVPRSAIAFGHAWRHLRQVSKLTGQPYARLLIAVRQELGELNGRFFEDVVGAQLAHDIRNALSRSPDARHPGIAAVSTAPSKITIHER